MPPAAIIFAASGAEGDSTRWACGCELREIDVCGTVMRTPSSRREAIDSAACGMMPDGRARNTSTSVLGAQKRMGILDFVKSGVQRMMIARADTHKDAVVYKHPDQTFPMWSQVTVDSDEVCLFFKDGQYVGALGPGRHTLQTQNIPFLNNLVDKFTGGNMFISELFFVTTKPLYNQGFGGPIGSMRDPELELRVEPRAYGTYSFRVVEPVRFVLEFWGQKASSDPDAALGWVRDQLMMGLKTTLTRLIKQGELTFMDLGTAGPDVARAIVKDCPDLVSIGVQVMEIAKLVLNLSDEDQKRIDQFQDQIVQSKLDARKARIAVSQAESQAQQRQFQLDQDYANRAAVPAEHEHAAVPAIRRRRGDARHGAGDEPGRRWRRGGPRRSGRRCGDGNGDRNGEHAPRLPTAGVSRHRDIRRRCRPGTLRRAIRRIRLQRATRRNRATRRRKAMPLQATRVRRRAAGAPSALPPTRPARRGADAAAPRTRAEPKFCTECGAPLG